jgi:hypothetical protein
VEKIESTTPKRAPNQTLTAESKAILKPSCGSLEICTSHKEQNRELHKNKPRKSTPQPTSNPHQTQNLKQSVLQSPLEEDE